MSLILRIEDKIRERILSFYGTSNCYFMEDKGVDALVYDNIDVRDENGLPIKKQKKWSGMDQAGSIYGPLYETDVEPAILLDKLLDRFFRGEDSVRVIYADEAIRRVKAYCEAQELIHGFPRKFYSASDIAVYELEYITEVDAYYVDPDEPDNVLMFDRNTKKLECSGNIAYDSLLTVAEGHHAGAEDSSVVWANTELYESNRKTIEEKCCEYAPLILTGASGSGKKAILKKVCGGKNRKVFRKVVTYTDRPMRSGETKTSHRFLTEEKFREMELNNFFLETTEYCGHKYGSNRRSFCTHGKIPIAVLDIKGALAVKKVFPETLIVSVVRDQEDCILSIFGKDLSDEEKTQRILLYDRDAGNTVCSDLVLENNDSLDKVADKLIEWLERIMSRKDIILLRSDERFIACSTGSGMGDSMGIYKTNVPKKVFEDEIKKCQTEEDLTQLWRNLEEKYTLKFVDESRNVTAYGTSSDLLEDFPYKIKEVYCFEEK